MEMLCLVARRVQTTAWPGVVVARLHYTTFRDLYGGRGRSVGRENQYSGGTVFTSRTNEMNGALLRFSFWLRVLD